MGQGAQGGGRVMKPHEEVAREIARERERQVAVEGWTLEHDDAMADGELALAAAAYAINATGDGAVHAMIGRRPRRGLNAGWISGARLFWPWAESWWKPKSPRRDLVRAAALIVAEIERIDRAAARQRAREREGAA